MNKIRITAIRQTVYPDLMAKYENPIEHTCDVSVGQWMDEGPDECDDQLQRRIPSVQFLYRSN